MEKIRATAPTGPKLAGVQNLTGVASKLENRGSWHPSTGVAAAPAIWLTGGEGRWGSRSGRTIEGQRLGFAPKERRGLTRKCAPRRGNSA
jgi:hypothetical protein